MMRDGTGKAIAGGPLWRVRLLAVGGLLALLGLADGARPDGPPWWEAQLRLEVRGTYRVQAGGGTYDGEYLCSARWTGGLEKDEPDVLLYTLGAETEEWQIREVDISSAYLSEISEKDIAEKPVLRVNYFLRRENDLEVDFVLEGLQIPLHAAPVAFDLLLPSSHEDKQSATGRAYNAGIVNGSNRVFLDCGMLGSKKVEKAFTWRWESRTWSLDQKEIVTFRNRHAAHVTLTIIPRSNRRPESFHSPPFFCSSPIF